MSVKSRLLEFINALNISKRQFYARTGLANGTLDKVENIGSDKLEKIYNAYPDMNLVWLITGKGEMLEKKFNDGDEKRLQNKQEVIEDNKHFVPLQEIIDRLLTLETDMKLVKQILLKDKKD